MVNSLETARSLLSQALAAYRAGQHTEAEALYRRAVEQDPEYVDALNLLGALLYQQNRLDESLACFERVRSLQPANADPLNSVGIVLRAQGRLREAVDYYRQALAIRADHPEVYSNLGNALREMGDLEGAITAYRQALDLKPDHAEGHNNLGVALKDIGQLKDAIAHYQTAIQLKPNYPEAHHNLGSAFQKQGQLKQAITYYKQAIALKPNYAEAHHGLGGTLQQLRQYAEAEAYHQQAIALKPDFAEAYHGVANAMHQQGKLDDAIAMYQQALKLRPDYAEVCNNLGNALQAQNKVDDAIALYQRALELRPGMPEAHSNLGSALRDQGKYAEAIAELEKAIANKPDSAEIYNNLGNTYFAQGKLDEAIAAYRQSLDLQPDVTEVHSNLGNMLQYIGDYEGAFHHFDQALALQPDHAGTYNNMGIALRNCGRVSEALAAYNRAIELAPDCVEARWNLALNQLLEGDFASGFAGYEWRRQWRKFCQLHPPRPYSQPYWDGSSLVGKTLLIYCEQGLGDTIQFIRYVPVLAAQGARVLVECPLPLIRLLQGVEGIYQLIPQGNSISADFDYHVSLLSLPYLMGSTQETVPAQVPYLQLLGASKTLPLPKATTDSTPLKIGIVWSGNPANPYNRNRTVPLECLLELSNIPGIQLYSLQKEVPEPDAALLAAHPEVIDLRDKMDDFVDTAVLIQQLDRVISVDTAVTHLAGALGKPVWLLLPFSPDWRWMLHRADSPWYPTLQIFRQEQAGEWGSVFEQVRQTIAGEAEEKTEEKQVEARKQEIIGRKTKGKGKKARETAPKSKSIAPLKVEARNENKQEKTLPSELYAAVKYYNQGNFSAAEQVCQQLVAQQEVLEAWHLLGLATHQQKRFDEAIAHYNRVLTIDPNHHETYNNLAVAYQQQGNLEQAIACYEKALAIDSTYADAHNNFANALRDRGELDRAIYHYQKAIQHRPDYPDAYNNLGLAYYTQGQFLEAATAYRQAIEQKPTYHQAYNHLGNALKELGDFDEASLCYERAIALKPDYAKAFNNWGNVFRDRGELQTAMTYYDRAIQIEANFAEAHWNQALTHLLQGNLERGFAEYEWRWQVKMPNFQPMRQLSQPVWDGSDLNGKILFLQAEQGMGDVLHFFRYVAIAAAKGGRVLLECHKPLMPLLSQQPHVMQVVPYGSVPERFDVHAPLMSLPHILGTRLETIPASVPYLTVPPTDATLPPPLASHQSFKVGLVWTGNPQNTYNRSRTVPLQDLLPLAKLPGVQLYSLQKEMTEADSALLAAHPEVIDLREQMKTFVDTAALIQQLDLVISVDTAVTHLAGALGKSVWLFLPFAPDWRWMMTRNDSPWYPTVQLFRQGRVGDWKPVLQQIEAQLAETAANRAIAPAEMPFRSKASIDAQALIDQAFQYYKKHDYEAAANLCRQILAEQPDNAVALHTLGVMLCQLKQTDAAIAALRRVLELQPNYPEAWGNLAGLLHEQGDSEGAIAGYRKALEIQPGFVEAHQNLSIVLREQGELEGAIAHSSQALALKPNAPEIYYNLGFMLRQAGDIQGAIAHYRTAIKLKPDFVSAHKNLGHALLIQGDFLEGFIENEWRWQQDHWQRRPFTQPEWDGSDLNGKTILLHAEQGFGDTLQFIRFAPLVKAKGGRVVVECQAPLLRLLQSVEGIDQLISQESPLPDFDVHIPLLSLPRALGTTLENLPAQVPYLHSTVAAAETLSSPALKIGIAWMGNPNHRNNHLRSCKLTDFQPLLQVPNTQFFSLQKGDAEQDLNQHPELAIANLSPHVQDFADTAAWIEQLDLVITVDTSVAHLAGALGKPVWVLLHYAPDWRWMLQRADSPWYPNMRLFRQPKWADWGSVFEAVQGELEALAAGDLHPRVFPSEPAQTSTAAPIRLEIQPDLESDAGLWALHLALHLSRVTAQPVELLHPPTHLPPLYQHSLRSLVSGKGQPTTDQAVTRWGRLSELAARSTSEPSVGIVIDAEDLSPRAIAQAKSCLQVITPSQWATHYLHQQGIQNVQTLAWGVDTSQFHPAPRSGLFEGRFVVFSGGGFNYLNGQDLLLKAFQIFAKHHPNALLVTSWANSEATPLIDLPDDVVCHLGAMPYFQLAGLLREADVVVVPNRCSVNNALAIASLASGVPTILAANTGLRDLTQQNLGYPLLTQKAATPTRENVQLNGLTEVDVEELLETLERIFLNPEEASQRSQIAADFLKSQSWKHKIQQVEFINFSEKVLKG